MSFLSRFDRVLAVGRDTYVRFYPNPGFGVRLGKRRVALSVWGGLEVFVKGAVWNRVYAKFSRVKRPVVRRDAPVR